MARPRSHGSLAENRYQPLWLHPGALPDWQSNGEDFRPSRVQVAGGTSALQTWVLFRVPCVT